MNFNGLELKKLQLEKSLKRERERTAYLFALRDIRQAPGFEKFRERLEERHGALMHTLKSVELSPYEMGKAQGELKVLETWLKDEKEIQEALDRSASSIREIQKRLRKLPGFLQET